LLLDGRLRTLLAHGSASKVGSVIQTQTGVARQICPEEKTGNRGFKNLFWTQANIVKAGFPIINQGTVCLFSEGLSKKKSSSVMQTKFLTCYLNPLKGIFSLVFV